MFDQLAAITVLFFSCQPLRNGETPRDIGRYNVPGLPGLTGYSDVAGYSVKGYDPTGVFGTNISIEDVGVSTYPSDDSNTEVITFDAGRVNSCYGASDTVMPASVDMVTGLYLGRTA